MTPEHKQSVETGGKPAAAEGKRQASVNAGADSGKHDESKPDAKDEGRGRSGHDSLLNPDLIRKMIIFAIVQAAVIIICAGALMAMTPYDISAFTKI